MNKKRNYYVAMLDGKKIKAILGAKVKELRSNKGLTQEQFAENVGLQAQTIATIETGRSFISADVLAAFCNYFNVEPKIFLSKNINYLPDEAVNYINEIKRILPSFSNEKLREIYNILLAMNK
ncbi:MAG: helix-turn-helix domain-containing protein [Candidatus Gastranaerophilales bacterium]|nr:helix-turn-helix domain-containing protein [Candidatus Gastranaerophilales bacterium]